MTNSQVRRKSLKSRFPSQGYVEDLDRMCEISQAIRDLEDESEALSYHVRERIDMFKTGELVISKVDPNRVYEVQRISSHMVSYAVKTVMTDNLNQRTERQFGEST